MVLSTTNKCNNGLTSYVGQLLPRRQLQIAEILFQHKKYT